MRGSCVRMGKGNKLKALRLIDNDNEGAWREDDELFETTMKET